VITPDYRQLPNKPQSLVPVWVMVTLASAILSGVTLGLSVALLVLAGGALLLVIGLFWWSLHSLTGAGALTLEEALSMAAPSVEEEQKRSVLRALKDLELEKSLGKISDEDYRTLSSSYRQQAKDLIRALDASTGPLRAEIDQLVAERMKQSPEGPRKKKAKRLPEPVPAAAPDDLASAPDAADDEETAPAPSADESDPAHDAVKETKPAAAVRVCQACEVPNDVDARFCKRCGAAFEEP